MNKQLLLQLENFSRQTPNQLRERQAKLFQELTEKAAAKLRKRIETRELSKELRKKISKLQIKPEQLEQTDLKDALAKAVFSKKMPADEKAKIKKEFSAMPALGKLDDLLQPDTPLESNPFLQGELLEAKSHRLGEVAGLKVSTTAKLIGAGVTLNNLSNKKFAELVKDKLLTESEAKQLGFSANLYQLFDSNFELTEAVKKSIPIKSLRDLAGFTKSDWQGLMKQSKIEPPEGITKEDYGTILYKKVTNLFPVQSLLSLITTINTKELSKDLQILQPLFQLNEKVFSPAGFDILKTDELPTKELKELFNKVNQTANLHPGLKLDEIFNSSALSPAQKTAEIQKRLTMMNHFVKNNEQVDYMAIRFTHDSDDWKALNFSGLGQQEQKMVLDNVKTYQRIYSVTRDIPDTGAIVGAGFHSAWQISSTTPTEFARLTGLQPVIAERYFDNANQTIIRSAAAMGPVVDLFTGSFDWTNVSNTDPHLGDYLRRIAGHQDLFGQFAFCDCEHCQSIFSPAAYFVDLMQWVEKYIIQKHFSGAKANHVLNLKVRRPDLWALPLTCENTNTLVPYLDIINEILESYIANKRGFRGNLHDRNAVEDFVYKQQILHAVDCFAQPFHLALESVSVYLSHFEKTRADIARLLHRPQPEISNAQLNLSAEESQLIIQHGSRDFINRIYAQHFVIEAGKIKKFDVQLLLKPMSLSRKEVGKVFKTNFVTNNGTENIIIRGGKRDADSVQNDVEWIENLTYDSLDRAHRFVRLWKKTNLKIEELDLLLSQWYPSGSAVDITAENLTTLGEFIAMQEKINIPAEELCALCYQIPNRIIQRGKLSLLDSLFNYDDVVVSMGRLPQPAATFTQPSPTSQRVAAGLNIPDAQLAVLIDKLSPTLRGGNNFNLDLANLGLLYRHARLARLLNLNMEQFFQLLEIVPGITNGWIENFSQIEMLLDYHQWWKTTSFSLDEFGFILRTLEIPPNYRSKNEMANRVVQQVRAANAISFADTVFVFSSNGQEISEEQSRQIVNANNSVIEALPDGRNYRLRPTFDSSRPITIPAGITQPEIILRTTLINYHPRQLIPHFLATVMEVPEAVIASLITALRIDLEDDAYLLELQGTRVPPAAISSLVDRLFPLVILFGDSKFDSGVVKYILQHLSLFGITAPEHLSLRHIRRIYSFLSYLTEKTPDGDWDFQLLSQVLSSFSTTSGYQTAEQAKLARVLSCDVELLGSLYPLTSASENAIDALDALRILVDACKLIGVRGDVLPNIVSPDYDALMRATNAILASFRIRYRDSETRNKKLEKYQDKIRGRKRSSLTTYLHHSGFPQFEKEESLFHYFLVDTELEGCARTSRLVAATMSLQLYIHRIFLNLEQDDQPPGTPGRVHLGIDPEHPSNPGYKPLPPEEWVWRKNYRVWEANRKVFLYPENYIEPDLRDDKTPLFAELESTLLQNDITPDNVLDAYGKYMRGFDEVAHLKIAGSFLEKHDESQTDTVHLFGVTAGDPPVYYYRKVENLFYSQRNRNRGIVWHPWQKVNVQIPMRKAAPIIYNGRLHLFWVNISTLSNTVFEQNTSCFIGYSHKFSIEFTTLKLDGSWTPPQKLNLKNNHPFTNSMSLPDPLVEPLELLRALGTSLLGILRTPPFFDLSSLTEAERDLRIPRYDTELHEAPKDDYTLTGFLWDQVYPSLAGDQLFLTAAGYQMRSKIDFYNLDMHEEFGRPMDPHRLDRGMPSQAPIKLLTRENNILYAARNGQTVPFDPYPYCSLLVSTQKNDPIINRHWNPDTVNMCFDTVDFKEQLSVLPRTTTIQIINGGYSDAVIDVNGDLLLLQGSGFKTGAFYLRRIGTTLSETLTRTLFSSGIDSLLDIETQKILSESMSPIATDALFYDEEGFHGINFHGAYGNYYREIFFHIPFLIANHLNSQSKWADAQKWYHYIFNPTAVEVITIPDESLTAEEARRREANRNWRFIEFRNLTIEKLRAQLNNQQAIEVYKKQPFNPHAIARLRLSAYQKSIVMKYVDNLLDWGDQLFTEDTMESVNEATLLYIIAKEILGDRPPTLADCGEDASVRTYESIRESLNRGSEFLAELEHYTYTTEPTRKAPSKQGAPRQTTTAIAGMNEYLIDSVTMEEAARQAYREFAISDGSLMSAIFSGSNLSEFSSSEIFSSPLINERAGSVSVKGTVRTTDWQKDSLLQEDRNSLPSFVKSILKQVSPVFCIPGNERLLEYYDRIDDRLYKIRNCMNILGERRQLALFAPEIDPALLVRARAAGLSLEDILTASNGDLPPYRFAYILEKAKSFTAAVQGFGGALLSAIEKRDNEELTRLRLVHQQNLLELSSKSRKLEIDSANQNIIALNLRLDSLKYQEQYYQNLVSQNLSQWERLQADSRNIAGELKTTEAVLGMLSGILRLIPQVGAPTAMTFGGVQTGSAIYQMAQLGVGALATRYEMISASAGLAAGFDRRREGWRHQLRLVQSEIRQTEKNLLASEIRRDILIESEKIHKRTIEQQQEILEFYGDKFSNLGFYTWQSGSLQRIFKDAYNNALAVARLAEQAYRYECDDHSTMLGGNYFEPARAGLLSGERLHAALQTMERRWLENNYRKNEVDQAFSLAQLNPEALLDLKSAAKCEFSIPEVLYDLFYPGQYRRKIQSVRLTIPCVTGPYTNVSATLTLKRSRIRMNHTDSGLREIPNSRTTTIATSSAQNDAGVFQLNFRDDRYMPFESAGAISEWELSLPKNFRQFDYDTINDVIIHVSYTAEYNEAFRTTVETNTANLQRAMNDMPLSRMISFRQEFSADFRRLIMQPAGTGLVIRIQDRHLPFFLYRKPLRITEAKLILTTAPGQTPGDFDILINRRSIREAGAPPVWEAHEDYFISAHDLAALFRTGVIGDYEIAIASPGNLSPAASEGVQAAVDGEKLKDILLMIKYTVV